MSENRAITTRQPAGGVALIQSIQDAATIAKWVADSKLFNCDNPAQAFVKIVAGAEMGFPPIAAMSDIHIIEGKPSVGAHLMAAAIRRSGKYDFEIREHTDEICTIAFFQLRNGQMQEMGVVTTTLQQAKDNGWTVTRKGEQKPTWKTKPKNMLFARTISDGYKWYCPDLTGGMLVYDRDEIESESLAVPPATTNALPHRQTTPFHGGGNAIDPTVDSERPTDLTVNEDGSLRSSLDDIIETKQSIAALVQELNVPPEKLKQRLVTHYGGVESYHHIDDLAELKRLESELLASRARAARQKQIK